MVVSEAEEKIKRESQQGRPERIALVGLFILGLGGAFYFLRSIILPLVLAVMLSYLLAPLIRALQRIRIPPAVSSAVILIISLATLASLVSLLAAPASNLIAAAPEGLHRLQTKLSPLKKPIEKLSKASGEVEKIVKSPSETMPAVEVKHGELAKEFFGGTADVVSRMVIMLILLYFLLSYSGFFLGKLVKVTPRFSDKKTAVSIAHQIEEKISHYLFTITLINGGLGLAVGMTSYLLGLPNPLLWGVTVFVLNFMPYLGAVVGISCMTLAALLSFENLTQALACPAAYLTLAMLEGNFITPALLGRSLTLNPVVIVISLMFWGWLWGIAGMILAVPILAAFKIICDHLPEPLAAVGEFLGD